MRVFMLIFIRILCVVYCVARPRPPLRITTNGLDTSGGLWIVDNVSELATLADCFDAVCLPGEDVQCGCLPLCNSDGICQAGENVCVCPNTNEGCPSLPPNEFCL